MKGLREIKDNLKKRPFESLVDCWLFAFRKMSGCFTSESCAIHSELVGGRLQ